MKVLIVSDTHRNNQSYGKLLKTEKPDMVIHCGDVEGSEYLMSKVAECPVYIVAGNCDCFSDLPLQLLVDIGPYKAMIVHGHTYHLYAGTDELKSAAASKGANIVFYGHTHVPSVEKEESVIAVNPGSLSYPRQEGKLPSYCVMEVDDDGKINLEIKYLNK